MHDGLRLAKLLVAGHKPRDHEPPTPPLPQSFFRYKSYPNGPLADRFTLYDGAGKNEIGLMDTLGYHSKELLKVHQLVPGERSRPRSSLRHNSRNAPFFCCN